MTVAVRMGRVAAAPRSDYPLVGTRDSAPDPPSSPLAKGGGGPVARALGSDRSITVAVLNTPLSSLQRVEQSVGEVSLFGASADVGGRFHAERRKFVGGRS